MGVCHISLFAVSTFNIRWLFPMRLSMSQYRKGWSRKILAPFFIQNNEQEISDTQHVNALLTATAWFFSSLAQVDINVDMPLILKDVFVPQLQRLLGTMLRSFIPCVVYGWRALPKVYLDSMFPIGLGELEATSLTHIIDFCLSLLL